MFSEVELGTGVTLFGGELEPAYRFGIVLADTPSPLSYDVLRG